MSLYFILFLVLGNVVLRLSYWSRCDGRTMHINLIILQTKKLNIRIAAVLGLFVIWHSWWTWSRCIFSKRRQDNLLGLIWNRWISSTFWQLLCRPMSCVAKGCFILDHDFSFLKPKRKRKGWRCGQEAWRGNWNTSVLISLSIWRIEGKGFCCMFLTYRGVGGHSYFGNSIASISRARRKALEF